MHGARVSRNRCRSVHTPGTSTRRADVELPARRQRPGIVRARHRRPAPLHRHDTRVAHRTAAAIHSSSRGSGAKAREITVSKGASPAACARRARAGCVTFARPSTLHGVVDEAQLLGHRIDQRELPLRVDHGQRQAGEAAARAHVGDACSPCSSVVRAQRVEQVMGEHASPARRWR